MKKVIIESSMTRQSVVEVAVRDFLYANRRRAGAIRLMDTDWPQAPLLRSKLVAYVSLSVGEGTNPLVLSAIDRGALAYERRLGEKPDWLRLAAFLSGVLDSLSNEMLGLQIAGARGGVWVPYGGQPLHAWLEHEKKGEIQRTKAAPDEARMIRKAVVQHLSNYLPDAAMERCNVL